MKFKLHEFYSGNLHKLVMKTNDNGRGYTNAYVTFEPGVEYTTTDDILIKFIKGEIGEVRENPVYTQDLEQTLTYYHIPYEKNKCSTCPTAKPHLRYNPFKILDEE